MSEPAAPSSAGAPATPSSSSSSSRPSPSTRLFLAFLAARLAFGLVFLTSAVRSTPVLWYLPLERRFELASTPSPGSLGIDWYGRSGLALFAALALGLAVYALAPRAPSLARPSFVLALARAGGLVLLIDCAYFAAVVLTRSPEPWPLPPWYCPR